MVIFPLICSWLGGHLLTRPTDSTLDYLRVDLGLNQNCSKVIGQEIQGQFRVDAGSTQNRAGIESGLIGHQVMLLTPWAAAGYICRLLVTAADCLAGWSTKVNSELIQGQSRIVPRSIQS